MHDVSVTNFTIIGIFQHSTWISKLVFTFYGFGKYITCRVGKTVSCNDYYNFVKNHVSFSPVNKISIARNFPVGTFRSD